jgi:type IV secretory pathway VirB4 component
MLGPAPIGIHEDKLFNEPEFSVPAEAHPKHVALFGGTGTGKTTTLENPCAATSKPARASPCSTSTAAFTMTL